MNLNEITKIKSNKGKSKRLGRGYGSGKGGHTVGKGVKGQKSRQGNSIPFGFEGGQTPLYKRLPRWGGFKNPTTKNITAVRLTKFNVFADNTKVTPQDLVEKKIIKVVPKDGVKVLANGDLEKKLEFAGFMFSKVAREKIEKSGGKIE